MSANQSSPLDSVSIIGTVAFDSIRTPQGQKDRILGGSATYAGLAASIFSHVSIISIVGKDFPQDHLSYFNSRNISTDGIHISQGDTFHWKGYYEGDMNQAHTEQTDLNVLLEFDPVVPHRHKDHKIVFLANIDPDLQKKALAQFTKPEVVILDTMNFWIESKIDALIKNLKDIDILIINDQEIRQLTQTSNIIEAMPKAHAMGPKRIIVKKGEHGAIMYNGKDHFICPAYPLTKITDPTGAGDSFAGAIAGFLAQSQTLDETAYRKAVVIGTLVSSFTVQGFSMDTLKHLNWETIEQKYNELSQFSQFPAL